MLKKIIIHTLIVLFLVTLIFSNYIKVIEVNGVIPDFILILTVLNGFFIDPIFAIIFGFFSGLAVDISYYPLLGFYALIYTIIGYSTSISKVIYINNSLISTILIFIFFIFKSILFLILGFFFMETEYIAAFFRPGKYFIEIIYTLLISIPFFLIYRNIYSRSRKNKINV
jgi:rod shape-determining protein MreD